MADLSADSGSLHAAHRGMTPVEAGPKANRSDPDDPLGRSWLVTRFFLAPESAGRGQAAFTRPATGYGYVALGRLAAAVAMAPEAPIKSAREPKQIAIGT